MLYNKRKFQCYKNIKNKRPKKHCADFFCIFFLKIRIYRKDCIPDFFWKQNLFSNFFDFDILHTIYNIPENLKFFYVLDFSKRGIKIKLICFSHKARFYYIQPGSEVTCGNKNFVFSSWVGRNDFWNSFANRFYVIVSETRGWCRFAHIYSFFRNLRRRCFRFTG